jgi:tetratricopeptide (TPR) repeat protein
LRRAELFCFPLLVAAVLLAACGSPPKPAPEPRLRLQAQAIEASAARRFAQGDYSAAASHFAEAIRLHLSLDDASAAARNRLQLAQAFLSLGQAKEALAQTDLVREDNLQVQALLLQVQALLALNDVKAARLSLPRLEGLCAASCAERGRVRLLQARTAWSEGDASLTLTQADAALPLLRAQQEEREVANAWRLVAVARLKLSDTSAALKAAQAALEIDRQLALPEKITRDWLLIGDVLRRAGNPDAGAAYRRAQSVAQAAGLHELAKLATSSLIEASQ